MDAENVSRLETELEILKRQRSELEKRCTHMSNAAAELLSQVENEAKMRVLLREQLIDLCERLNEQKVSSEIVSVCDDGTLDDDSGEASVRDFNMHNTEKNEERGLVQRLSLEALREYVFEHCTAAVAESILSENVNMSFLLRSRRNEADDEDLLALSYKDEYNQVWHCRIEKSDRGWRLESETEFHANLVLLLIAYGLV